jgi:hypothetical protein
MTPTFQFFEDVCNELHYSDEAVLPEDTFLSEDMLRDLQDEYEELNPEAVVPKVLTTLEVHFEQRGSKLPFQYDLPTRSFSISDKEYVEFVARASGMRGVRKNGKAFELATADRLKQRGVGNFHRVGWPRSKDKEVKSFNKYLQTLGFDGRVALGRDKDGGLDILWILPFGTVPHRPIISFQCKNGSYDIEEAFKSNGATEMSLACHLGLSVHVHTICVVFNDYIEDSMLSRKPYHFVPLGLSDLASQIDPITTLTIL